MKLPVLLWALLLLLATVPGPGPRPAGGTPPPCPSVPLSVFLLAAAVPRVDTPLLSLFHLSGHLGLDWGL